MKKRLLALYMMLMLIVSGVIMVSCSKSVPADESEQAKQDMGLENPDIDNPVYENEQEGVEVTEATADQEAFYGNWEAASDRAEYLYGNLNLSIMKGGNWEGNITEEDFKGTWKYNGTGITISSELINADLFFSSDGALMFKDHESPDSLLVLTPVK